MTRLTDVRDRIVDAGDAALLPPPTGPPDERDLFADARPEPAVVGGEVASAIANTIQRPLRTVSNYYCLYHLVELDGVDELAFDWKMYRDDLFRAFYLYGVYTVAKELCHVAEQYYFEGRRLLRYVHLLNELPDDSGHGIIDVAERSLEAARALSPTHPDLAAHFAARGGNYQSPVRHQPSIESISQFVTEVERATQAFTHPDRLLTTASEVFTTGVHTGRAISETSEVIEQQTTGWMENFNGPAWRGIVDHLERRDAYPPTSWVDVSLALEHNGGGWFDKVHLAPEERDVAMRVEDQRHLPNETMVRMDNLAGLLDAGREEHMGTLRRYAEAYDDLGYNLRRYRHLLQNPPGVPESAADTYGMGGRYEPRGRTPYSGDNSEVYEALGIAADDDGRDDPDARTVGRDDDDGWGFAEGL